MGRAVVTFVDYENIRISLSRNFDPQVSAGRIAGAIKDLALTLGDWRGGRAYADWSTLQRDARAFQDAGFDPRMVLRKRGGSDRSDVTMSLDVVECLTQPPPIDVVLLASGDSDFQEAVRRVKDHGAEVVVAGCMPTMAAGLASMADQVVAIEARLKLRPKAEVEVARSLPAQDWKPLIELMARLEQANRYIGANRLVNVWMADNAETFGGTTAARRSHLDSAERDGVVETYRETVELEGGSTRPVWCVRLNRSHALVSAELGLLQEAPGAADEHPGPAEPVPL